MNAERRKKLEEIWSVIDTQLGLLRDIIADEQNAFDCVPESLQGGEKGQAMEAAIDTLQDAEQNLDDALEGITSISGGSSL